MDRDGGYSPPDYRSLPDNWLMDLVAAKGDEDAFRVLYERFRARLLAMLSNMPKGRRGEAEDALQETFIRVWKSRNKWRSFGAWVQQIAKNEGWREPPMWQRIMTPIAEIPRKGAGDSTEPIDSPGMVLPEADAVPLLDLIERCLQRDPDRELTFDWIANGCNIDNMLNTPRYRGCNRRTLENKISKVRVRLRACLKANDYGDYFREEEGEDGGENDRIDVRAEMENDYD